MRFTDNLVLMVLSILISFSGRADTAESAREARTQHIKEMAAQKISNPSIYDGLYKKALIKSKMLLGRLGYDVGPFDLAVNDRVISAIKAYEKNRGIPITGDPLAFDTSQRVAKDLESADKNYADPGPFVFTGELWDMGSVHVQGTWSIVGENQHTPVQGTTIKCDKLEGKCYSATAIQGAQEFGGGYISSEAESYEIERWDNLEIVTRPYEYLCTRIVYRISRLHKSVTGTRSTISKAGVCKETDNREFTLKMVDGGEIVKQLRREQQQDLLDLSQLSPDARAIFGE